MCCLLPAVAYCLLPTAAYPRHNNVIAIRQAKPSNVKPGSVLGREAFRTETCDGSKDTHNKLRSSTSFQNYPEGGGGIAGMDQCRSYDDHARLMMIVLTGAITNGKKIPMIQVTVGFLFKWGSYNSMIRHDFRL